MPLFTLELDVESQKEADFANFIRETCKSLSTMEDCRKLAPVIKQSADYHGLDFVIGCGGSHIWLHRRRQHVEGDCIKSDRWAIISDK